MSQCAFKISWYLRRRWSLVLVNSSGGCAFPRLYFTRLSVDVTAAVRHYMRLLELDGERNDKLLAILAHVGHIERHVVNVDEAALELVGLVHHVAFCQVR